MAKNKKYKWILLPLLAILIFLIGIGFGMLLGTYTLIDHVTQGLAGSTFIVNFNETRLVDYTLQRMNDTIIPQLKYNQLKGADK